MDMARRKPGLRDRGKRASTQIRLRAKNQKADKAARVVTTNHCERRALSPVVRASTTNKTAAMASIRVSRKGGHLR